MMWLKIAVIVVFAVIFFCAVVVVRSFIRTILFMKTMTLRFAKKIKVFF